MHDPNAMKEALAPKSPPATSSVQSSGALPEAHPSR
jgi:hypothetical protein